MVSVASALKISNGAIEDARIVCGAAQATPRLLNIAEDAIEGSPQNDKTVELAGKSVSRGAVPLNYNHYKIPLMQNLVKRSIRDA